MIDPYSVLGVSKDATEDQVKQAYKQAAKKWHPDLNKAPEAAEKFREATEAYNKIKNPEPAQPQNHTWNGGGFRTADPFSQFGFGFDLNDLLNSLHRSQQRNQDISAGVSVTLEEAFNGKSVEMSVHTQSGYKHVQFDIPRGIEDGNQIKLAGAGDRTYASFPAGDLFVSVHLQPHEIYTRVGINLVMSQTVDVFDAMLGCSLDVPTIDGGKVQITVPKGIQHGQKLRVPGRGMTVRGMTARGDMIVEIFLKIPSLTPSQLEKVKEIKETIPKTIV